MTFSKRGKAQSFLVCMRSKEEVELKGEYSGFRPTTDKDTTPRKKKKIAKK